MSARNRIALYGGTFDPVHLGHLQVARSVTQLFEIDLLLFIPAQLAPHKLSAKVTAPMHRYAMLALATLNDSQLFVSTYELNRPDRKYTVNTVDHFQKVLGEAADLFFVMGADSWEEIDTWRDWERLLSMTNHIVVTRPGYEIGVAHVKSEIEKRVIDVRGHGVPKGQILGPSIFFTDSVNIDISATRIRQAVNKENSTELNELVPDVVVDYIRKYRLYRDSNETEFFS